jgi:MoaA/NifB/PqqE/SkfB family radical SAM enzyme
VTGRGLFEYPRKIQIQTIDLCNYRCPMCPYPALSEGRVPTRMRPDLFTRIITDVREAGRRVRLCLMLQNEPLLDPGVYDLIEEANAAQDAIISVSTVTNGSALTSRKLTRLVGFERLQLTVSVNANEAGRYRAVHGVDSWDRVHDLLATWEGPRDRVRLSFVMDSASVEEARRFVARWTEAGYATRLVPIMSRAGTVPVEAGRRPVVDDFDHCHYPVDTLNVLTDGTVILCCNDWEHHETFGNVGESTIAEVWNGPALTRIRHAALDGRIRDASSACRGCDYPMRSAVRMQLEKLGSTDTSVMETTLDVVDHVTELRLPEGGTVPVVVFAIDAGTGTVTCAADAAERWVGELKDGGPCELCIRIAHGERFSFGSLEPTWCPGQVWPAGRAEGDDLAVLRIHLDRESEAFRLLPWYSADWRPPAGRALAGSTPRRRLRVHDSQEREPLGRAGIVPGRGRAGS